MIPGQLTQHHESPGADPSHSSLGDLAVGPGLAPGTRIGRLAGYTDDGCLLVDDGSPSLRLALIACGEDDARLAAAARCQGRVIVTEVNGRLAVLGLVRERLSAAAMSGETPAVTLDGTTVRMAAAEEIVLQCGKSKLVLRKSGKVELSGSYVVTRSTGPNKIKGASIALN